MTINYQAMPERVATVHGPVVKFPAPVEMSDVRGSIAEGGYVRFNAYNHQAELVQLVLRRDFNYFRTPHFVLGFQGELSSPDGKLHVIGDISEMARQPVMPHIEAADGPAFSDAMRLLNEKTELMASRFGGVIQPADPKQSYAFVHLPYYRHALRVTLEGALLSPVHPESAQSPIPDTGPARYPRKVALGKYRWRRRLENMSSAGWERLAANTSFQGMERDEHGLYAVRQRRGIRKIIRPNDCQPV